jgi:predicted MFS family arabinose efflux permease
MFSILFILIIDGLCYGIHISEITHMIPRDTPQSSLNLYAGYCNVALGCGATLGGYISGKLGDILDSKKTGSLGIIMFLMGCVLAIATLEFQNFYLTLSSAFFWGFFLFYIEGWLYIVCSK